MNLVAAPPTGLVLALQYWAGDEVAAMRLARLLADIEPARRKDVTLALVRRFDTPPSDLMWKTALHCGFKFGVMQLVSEREGAGHPRGCNELFAGMMDQLSAAWADGLLAAHSVMAIEADGCPLRADWLDVLLREHAMTLAAGKRVTGHLMTLTDFPHVNGTLGCHLSLWLDRPSLRSTPPHQAWDMHHAAVYSAEARPTTLIRNFYGSRDWTPGALAAVAKETAWLSSVKDESAISWAERTLAARAAEGPR